MPFHRAYDGASGTGSPDAINLPMTIPEAAPEHPLFSRLREQFVPQREIGRGGMGVVYLARDEKLERPVAIKVLPQGSGEQQETRERFLREARIAGQLSHPNIVPIYRADEIDGHAFIVMAFVEGESLADRIMARGTLDPEEVAQVLREVSWALAYAHARGVIHRDVKPDNILIEKATGRALVTDFGIARDVAASRLTADGTVLGTVHYMSPEQVSNDTLDGRSDLYALGVVGFQALTGRLPFDEGSAAASLVAHVTKAAPRVNDFNPAVPAELAAVIDRCLSKDPAGRYESGEALAEALTKAVTTMNESPDSDKGMSRVLSESEAAAIWKRAAQLQAEALQRIETRVAVTQHLSGDHGMVPGAEVSGYRLKHVQEAAEEAGISRQFVALALAEIGPGQKPPVAAASDERADKRATLLLGSGKRSLSVSRIINDPPARVLKEIGSLLQRDPFSLQLREIIGGHPLDGGVMVFDLPGNTELGVTISTTAKWVNTRQYLEARQVQVTIKPLGPNRTEVSMFVDLRPGVKPNAAASGILSGLLGGIGGTIAGVAAMKAAGTALMVFAPAAGIAFLGIGGGTAAWYRWFYQRSVDKAAREMSDALAAIEGSMRAEEVFGGRPKLDAVFQPLGSG
jgi:serine/threonine protein kinase